MSETIEISVVEDPTSFEPSATIRYCEPCGTWESNVNGLPARVRCPSCGRFMAPFTGGELPMWGIPAAVLWECGFRPVEHGGGA